MVQPLDILLSILAELNQHSNTDTYRSFQCLKEGTVTVTITDKYTGKSVVQEITVVSPKVVTGLPYEDVVDVPAGDHLEFYSYTPSEKGIYRVSRIMDMSKWGASISVEGGSMYLPFGENWKTILLDAGTTYKFEVSFQGCDGTETDVFRIERCTEEENQTLVLLNEQLEIKLRPTGTTQCRTQVYYTGTDTLSWTSSDPSVAQFSSENNGTVNCSVNKVGTATITVTDGTYSDSMVIVVSEYPALQLDIPLSINTAESGMFVFTAPEQGEYAFIMDSGEERLKARLETVYPADLTYAFTETTSTISKKMEAGETYWFLVTGTDDAAVDQNVTLTASKAGGAHWAVMQIHPTHHKQSDYLVLRAGFTPVTYGENIVTWEVSDKNILGERNTPAYGSMKAYDIYITGEVTVTATSENGTTASCTMVVGTCGDNTAWFLQDGTLTVFGSGKVADYGRYGEYDRQDPLAPWQPYSDTIRRIVVEEGITELGRCTFIDCINVTNISLPETLRTIGAGAINSCTVLTDIVIPERVSEIGIYAFTGCESLTEISLPKGITHISEAMFSDCYKLRSITIPANVKSLGELAFALCEDLETIYFEGDAPTFASAVFMDVVATAYYPADNTSWTETVMQNYEGNITWKRYCPNGHAEVIDKAVEATCTTIGLTEGKHCSVCDEILLEQTIIPAGDHIWQNHICTACGVAETYRVDLKEVITESTSTVWINGVPYEVQTDEEGCYIDLPGNVKSNNMVTYSYYTGNPSDIHTQYPVGMKVWTLSNEGGTYTATRIEELDNILQYSGTSIRVTGKQGIRMITSIEKSKKNDLISDGLAGYTLREYGTVVAWASQLEGGKPLVLGESYTKSNYAYKKGIADPIFADDGNLTQYTNVLVGFSLEQCKNDLAMRPYMILEDANGEEITLYGGIVQRSIGYIALQNRDTFAEGTEAHDYILDIIHDVYGDDL